MTRDFVLKLLNSKNPTLRERALKYLSFGTDDVGMAAIKATAQNQGELYAMQLILGVAKDKRVGFDPISTLLKAQTIKNNKTSDVFEIAEKFLSAIKGTLEAMNIIEYDEDGVARIIEDAKKILPPNLLKEILEEYEFAKELLEQKNREILNTSYGTVLRDQLIKKYRTKESYFTMEAYAKQMYDTIQEFKRTKLDRGNFSKTASEIAKFHEAILPGGAIRIDNYIGNIFSDRTIFETGGRTVREELELYNKIKTVQGIITQEGTIRFESREIVQEVADIFNMPLGMKDTFFSNQLKRAGLSDAILGSLRETEEKMGQKIVGDLQKIIDNVEAGSAGKVQTIITQLQLLLAKRKEIALGNVDLNIENSQALKALGDILDKIFQNQLDQEVVKSTLTIDGIDYAISDLASLAENKTTMTLLAGDRETLDEVIEFLKSQSKSEILPETDFLGEQYLTEVLDYNIAKQSVTKETGELLGVPKFIDPQSRSTVAQNRLD
jgi:hypothetical protein